MSISWVNWKHMWTIPKKIGITHKLRQRKNKVRRDKSLPNNGVSAHSSCIVKYNIFNINID